MDWILCCFILGIQFIKNHDVNKPIKFSDGCSEWENVVNKDRQLCPVFVGIELGFGLIITVLL